MARSSLREATGVLKPGEAPEVGYFPRIEKILAPRIERYKHRYTQRQFQQLVGRVQALSRPDKNSTRLVNGKSELVTREHISSYGQDLVASYIPTPEDQSGLPGFDLYLSREDGLFFDGNLRIDGEEQVVIDSEEFDSDLKLSVIRDSFRLVHEVLDRAMPN